MFVLEGSSSIAFSAGPTPDRHADLKRPGMVVLSSGESHLFAANVSQQEQLRGVEKVELSPVNTVEPERRISPQLSPHLKVTPAVQESNETNPTRCLFSFSDGRHCRLPRAETDPRFCLHHTADNVKAKKVRKQSRASQAIVELETPSGEFTTATDLNYALSQVFRSLAQKHIRPRNAATLGYLGQLLLQTLPGVKSEFSNTFGYRAWDESVKAMLNAKANEPPAAKQPQPSQNEHLRINDHPTRHGRPERRTGAKDLSAPDTFQLTKRN